MGAPRRDAQTAGVSLGVLITTAEREQDLFLFHKPGSDESGISISSFGQTSTESRSLEKNVSLPLLVY